MKDPLDEAYQLLRREYLTALPLRLDELRADIAGIRGGAVDAVSSLRARLHRLAGSGGSYGFPELSAIAREAERSLSPDFSPQEPGLLDSLVERLAEATTEIETKASDALVQLPAEVTPRALVIMRPSPQRERIGQELRTAGYEVRFGDRRESPATTPQAELPHLVVIGGEAGDGDPSAVATLWTNSSTLRPGAVVLVETLRAVDRLRAVAAGVDAVFPADQVEQKLPRYARTFARIGPPPSSVLLVDHDQIEGDRLSHVLEEANIRVARCRAGLLVLEALQRDPPDLLLLKAQLPDSDGFAIARLVRQDPRYQLLPIVMLGPEGTAERIASLKAGAEDYVASAVDPQLLVQLVVSRSTRGRRVRELVHRDAVTGLLNHVTLLAELEHAVEYSRSHGEPLALLLFELDGFRRISERLGPRGSEEVLLHIAGVFRANVRASDVIGRYGSEAFGMLLRGANADGAAVLADKLHRVLGDQPAQTAGGEQIQLKVRVGSAAFPRDGLTAAGLAHAAERALREPSKEVRGKT